MVPQGGHVPSPAQVTHARHALYALLSGQSPKVICSFLS